MNIAYSILEKLIYNVRVRQVGFSLCLRKDRGMGWKGSLLTMCGFRGERQRLPAFILGFRLFNLRTLKGYGRLMSCLYRMEVAPNIAGLASNFTFPPLRPSALQPERFT